MSWLDLVIAAFATYGFSSLGAYYNGLFNVFLRVREKYPKSAFVCPVCLSVWASVVALVVVYLGFAWLLMPLAIVGFVIVLEKL